MLKMEGPALWDHKKAGDAPVSPVQLAHEIGFTFIERGPTGAVLSAALKPFGSFTECCAAAEKAAKVQTAQLHQFAQVVSCRYDDKECIPDMQPVLKIYEQSADFN